MPAPKLNLHDLVVARDGSKGEIIETIDFGESALPRYGVVFEDGRTVELAESELALAPAPAPAPAKDKKAAVDGATSEGDQGGKN